MYNQFLRNTDFILNAKHIAKNIVIALVEFSAWRFCRDIRKKTDRQAHRQEDRQTHRPTDIQELWKHLVTPNYWHYIRKEGIGRGC